MLREIVAVMYGENRTITNRPKDVVSVLELNLPFEPIRRDVCQFMASMDLGNHWRKLANGPTLFLFDTETKEVFPYDVTQTRLDEPAGTQPDVGTTDEGTVQPNPTE